MKAALLQLCAGQDKTANIARARAMAREALEAGAKLVLLPEVFNFRGDARNKELFTGAMEEIPGPSTTVFGPLAQQYQASFLLGSILEKAGPAHAYNTSVLINPRGEVTAKYRKIHLFDACIGDKIIREADFFLAGRGGALAQVEGFRAGLSICYDLRFPELYQEYSRKGVDILTAPSCFTKKTGEAHWETLLRARAIENLAYVLAPNQVGTDARGMQAYGHSMIVSPWGEIIARGSGDAQEIIYGDILIDEVRKARQILPGIVPGINDVL